MASQADEKAIRLIQGVIREGAIGQVMDSNLAGALARKIVVALRTIKSGPAKRKPAKPAFMAVPGADGQTEVEKVTPTRVGAVPVQAEEKKAWIQGDNVDHKNVHPDVSTPSEHYEDLLPDEDPDEDSEEV